MTGELTWIVEAMARIERYLERGDNPRSCETAIEFNNVVGYALGFLPNVEDMCENIKLSLDVPDCHTPFIWHEIEKDHPDLFREYELYAKESEAFKRIAVISEIFDQEFCDGVKSPFTILPLVLHYKNDIHEFPLFRAGDSFVDCNGRVYKSFQDWKDKNDLPKGDVLFWNDGKIPGKDVVELLDLSIVTTPSGRNTHKVLQGVDVAAGIGSLITTGLLIGSAVIPVLLPVVPIIAAADIVCASYGASRATAALVDRGLHKQSINPFKSEAARVRWLSAGSCVVGIGAGGLSTLTSKLAANGANFSKLYRGAVDTVNVASLSLGAFSAAQQASYIARNHRNMTNQEKIKEAFFLILTVGFFAKGLTGFKSANTIISDSRKAAIQSYSEGFSRNQRKKMRRRINRHGEAYALEHMIKQQNINASTVTTTVTNANIDVNVDQITDLQTTVVEALKKSGKALKRLIKRNDSSRLGEFAKFHAKESDKSENEILLNLANLEADGMNIKLNQDNSLSICNLSNITYDAAIKLTQSQREKFVSDALMYYKAIANGIQQFGMQVNETIQFLWSKLNERQKKAVVSAIMTFIKDKFRKPNLVESEEILQEISNSPATDDQIELQENEKVDSHPNLLSEVRNRFNSEEGLLNNLFQAWYM